jgi:hypothetical protein
VAAGLRALAVVLLALASACGASSPPPPKASAAPEAHWQDVFDAAPELLVTLRPAALRQDKVYGPLLRRIIDLARERSRVVAATRLIDAIEDADEVMVGVRPGAAPGDDARELVIVLRGVRADLDPAKLVDEGGQPVWAAGPHGAVRELVRERDERGRPVSASLFELPGRTWVIASGDARARARDAFAHPMSRPPMKLDPDALAIVRLDGPSLVARVRTLQTLGGLAAVGRRLKALTLELPPRAAPMRATFSYADEDAAAVAEVTLREVVGAIARKKPDRFAWLATATVDRPRPAEVIVTAPLPAELIYGLLHAGELPLDVPPP